MVLNIYELSVISPSPEEDGLLELIRTHCWVQLEPETCIFLPLQPLPFSLYLRMPPSEEGVLVMDGARQIAFEADILHVFLSAKGLSPMVAASDHQILIGLAVSILFDLQPVQFNAAIDVRKPPFLIVASTPFLTMLIHPLLHPIQAELSSSCPFQSSLLCKGRVFQISSKSHPRPSLSLHPLLKPCGFHLLLLYSRHTLVNLFLRQQFLITLLYIRRCLGEGTFSAERIIAKGGPGSLLNPILVGLELLEPHYVVGLRAVEIGAHVPLPPAIGEDIASGKGRVGEGGSLGEGQLRGRQGQVVDLAVLHMEESAESNQIMNIADRQKILSARSELGLDWWWLYLFMDPRLYIYELRRPRVANPTFNSSHVNNTCFSIYSGGPLNPHSTPPPPPPQQNLTSSLSLPRPQRIAPSQSNKEEPRSRASSNLSNYGSSLLRVQDKDVYQKQQQRFNIISMEPVSNGETIKKYPKLTLEDKDAYYFRKMAQDQLHKQHSQQLQERTQNKHESTIAGKHTYGVQGDKVPLNLWESYGSGPQKHARFTAGMLNHVDEFRSLI